MDGNVVIGTELDTKSFDEQIMQTEKQLERLNNSYQKALNPPKGMKVSEEKLQSLRLQIEQTGNKLSDLRKKQANLESMKTDGLEKALSRVGAKTKSVITQTIKWGLALFGIRSIYGMLSSSASTLSQYNQQIGVDMQYIRFALASTLQPVIEYLIQLAYKLLSLVNAIAQAWFGVNIFARATTDNFNKMDKSLGGASKGAKDLKKQLAGFDEMNVLQDQSSSGGGAGAGGLNMPSMDLSLPQEAPQWITWLDELLALISGITAGLIAMKVFGLDPITSLGIGLIVAGLVYAIEGLLKYLKDPTWENFGQIIQGIGIAVVGLGIVFLGLPAIITGVIILIVGTIIKYWDEIKAFLVKGITWLENSIYSVREVFGNQVASIYETFITMFKGIILGFETTFNGLRKILDGIIQFVRGVFKGDWKSAWEGIKTIFSGIFQSLEGIAIAVFSFISGIVVSIAQTVGYTIADAFKAVVNGILWAIETILNTPIKAVNKLIDVINAVPGINLGKLSTFKLPRLAKGGIINMPGRGVPIGGAIGGERGQEGVIPLTDSQQMALLGEAIGRYITINASITNTMNGRVISRELQRINNESDFAYNR